MKKLPSFQILLILGLLFSSACNPSSGAFLPESAVTQDLIQNQNAVTETIRIHQIQSWRDHSVVLASFMSKQENKQWGCEAVYDLIRGSAGWQMSGSGIGCSTPPNMDPVTYGSGTQGVAAEEFSYAYGLVTLNEAQWIVITWGDGVDQKVSLVNGSYLALRNGNIQNIDTIQVLNATEEVIHEIGNSTAHQK